jgi:hypothetical protein
VGTEGCTAVKFDDERIKGWATSCTLVLGSSNLSDPEAPVVSYGAAEDAVGPATTSTLDVVSLGDGGMATLTFANPIANGDGYDFAVFENPFNDYFLELAFVEVSSDGENYFQFPAVTNVPSDVQMGSFGVMEASLIHNFAGKYEVMYGTPFDLDELEDDAKLDKSHITHIRLVDVIGTINPEYATYDSEGHIVNDPWPTPFYSSGFDLDAVGVIHDASHNDVAEYAEKVISMYPNPVKDCLTVNVENLQSVEVYNLMGQQVMAATTPIIDFGSLNQGIYFVRVKAGGKTVTERIVKQ